MAKGRRITKRNPYEQGDAKLLYKLFYLPLIKFRPAAYHYRDFIDKVFCVLDREILCYKTTKPISFKLTIPGSDIKEHKAELKKGQRIWIRYDKTMPKYRDIEFSVGYNDKYIWGKINTYQWNKIRRGVKLIKLRKGQRNYVSWEKALLVPFKEED